MRPTIVDYPAGSSDSQEKIMTAYSDKDIRKLKGEWFMTGWYAGILTTIVAFGIGWLIGG